MQTSWYHPTFAEGEGKLLRASTKISLARGEAGAYLFRHRPHLRRLRCQRTRFLSLSAPERDTPSQLRNYYNAANFTTQVYRSSLLNRLLRRPEQSRRTPRNDDELRWDSLSAMTVSNTNLKILHCVIANEVQQSYHLIMVHKQFYVYIATNYTNTVLYIGITNNLIRRIYEHKNKLVSSFTSKYNILKLVYYEIYNDPETTIRREKQLKAGSRTKKLKLIKSQNPQFKDLYEEIIR